MQGGTDTEAAVLPPTPTAMVGGPDGSSPKKGVNGTMAAVATAPGAITTASAVPPRQGHASRRGSGSRVLDGRTGLASPDELEPRLLQGSEKVSLNLSGTVFVTTRDTLMRDERTYFAAMLRMQPPHHNEEPAAQQVADFFVDRDPTHFRHILNYLRGNRMNLECRGPESLAFLDELLLEAQYFNINGLCEDLARRIAEITRRQKEEASEDKDFKLIKCELSEVQNVFHDWVIDKSYEFETMQVCGDVCLMVLGRRVSRGELALVERLMKT